jgi:hypothetical protein
MREILRIDDSEFERCGFWRLQWGLYRREKRKQWVGYFELVALKNETNFKIRV